MEDNSNDFILDTMTWSFSRLESFYSCPYGWKKRYIDCESGESNAFAEYGTLAHKLLEEYSKGEIDGFDLATEYEDRFDDAVQYDFPPNKFVDMRETYYNKGLRYFEEFDGILPEEYEVLGVEKKVNFEIADKPFVGYIDLLVKTADGKIGVVDHKSASAKFKRNGEPAKAFAEKMLMYKRQLYLYCKALIDGGLQPDFLCWNFFNDQYVYKIPFSQEEYDEAIAWATETIRLIGEEENWEPVCDFYYCHYICDSRNDCEYCIWERKDDEFGQGDSEW